MKSFSELKRNLKKDFTGFKLLKIAILGDSATQLLTQALRGAGYEYKLDLQIWEADFNQINQQVYNPQSELYEFLPDVVVIFQSSHKLLQQYNKTDEALYSAFADNELDQIESLYKAISSKLNAKVIFYNYNEIDDAVFCNYANKIEQSFLFQLRKLNYRLMEFASHSANFYLCDLSSMQNQLGKAAMYQPAIYVNTDMTLSLEALPAVADRTVAILNAAYGAFKKCIIVDLDNTLWGGIIGDDGIENIQIGSLGIGKAFTEFQYWLKKLKNRGIILAVCSKNDEAVAREPFEKHPEMVLKTDDIAIFVANWNNKADNIKQIQATLNIGFDSMVFLDDNPFERSMVRENIPGITVPELPEDPANYLEYLYTLNLFETASISNADADRTLQYQKEKLRLAEQKTFINEADFLKSLQMVSLVEEFNKFNTPRVAQLSQRSNQFNLRTIRYTEEDIKRLSKQKNACTFAFSLKDKFGDNGLISIVVLNEEDDKTIFIETWLMSCRVLKRGMENFVLNTIVSFAKNKGYQYLKGEYLPTAKNGMVKDHYKNLVFTEVENNWILDISDFKERGSFISEE